MIGTFPVDVCPSEYCGCSEGRQSEVPEFIFGQPRTCRGWCGRSINCNALDLPFHLVGNVSDRLRDTTSHFTERRDCDDLLVADAARYEIG